MPGLLATVDAFFAPVLEELQPGAATALRPSQHADLQVDGVLALARALGRPPREVAEEVVARAWQLGLADLCESAEVAGPGFINLTLSGEFLANELRNMSLDPATLGVQPANPPKKAVVDYAGTERRKTDACRSPAFHDYRRLPGEVARTCRPQRYKGEPRRGLGYSVRDAYRAPHRYWRGRGSPRTRARGLGALLPAGSGGFRQRPRLLPNGPAPGSYCNRATPRPSGFGSC